MWLMSQSKDVLVNINEVCFYKYRNKEEWKEWCMKDE